MNRKTPPVVFDDDNPEWTEEDFARAKPANEVLSPVAAGALVRKRGRPAGSRNATRKEQIALRVDADVLAAYKSAGPGWQTQMNEALRPRIDVMFSKALKGWTAAVIQPIEGGRSHIILGKWDDAELAMAAAEKEADKLGRKGLRPLVRRHSQRAA